VRLPLTRPTLRFGHPLPGGARGGGRNREIAVGSPRPSGERVRREARRVGGGRAVLLGLLAVLAIPAALSTPVHAEPFAEFLRGFEAKAIAAGVRPEVYERATAGLTPDPTIPQLVEGQPEFTTPIWSYLDQRITNKRIASGKAAMEKNRALFDAVGKRFGVDSAILGAIWGVETDYGAVLGNSKLIKPIVRSLATLVYERRGRIKGDEADFIAALKLVQRGPLDAKHLVGSWAGAIGHLQVNPSNVIAHGSDGDGDGKIDLQDSLADALATSAKFLLDLGTRRMSIGALKSMCQRVSITCWRIERPCGRSGFSPSWASSASRASRSPIPRSRCFSMRPLARAGRIS
jgi:membrane-bound lytic murein transglycosylase B